MALNTHHDGKELVLRTLRHEKVSSVPWIPYAGIHAAKLKGYTPIEILRDSKKLAQSLLAVNETYKPDGQPVIFDLQIEAEIFGCELFWAENAPPSVASHPLANSSEIPQRNFKKEDGRLPVILPAMQMAKKEIGEHTALYGLVTGPLTLSAHLRGTDFFMDMLRQPDYIHRLVEVCKGIILQMAGFYIDAGMDVIAIVDPIVSQVSPKHFKTFLADTYTEIFDILREKKVFSSFFVCGNASKSIEVMCQTKPDSLAVDENVDMVFAKGITDQYNISLSGNIPIATTMLLGTPEDNMQYVVDLLDKLDHHNLMIAPGCDLPYDIPVENVIACMQALRNPEMTKEKLANYQKPYNYPSF